MRSYEQDSARKIRDELLGLHGEFAEQRLERQLRLWQHQRQQQVQHDVQSRARRTGRGIYHNLD